MACNTAIAAVVRDCESNVGGVKRVLVANFDDVEEVTLTSNVVTAVTMATGKTFTEIYVRPEVSNVTSSPQYNDAGDYAGESAVLALVINRQTAGKRETVDALSKNDLRVIYQDGNGLWWFIGNDRPVRRSGGDAVTGTAITDTNAYNVELTGHDNALPLSVDPTVITGILPA